MNVKAKEKREGRRRAWTREENDGRREGRESEKS